MKKLSLTSYTPYPSRKIRRICFCTPLKTTKEQDSIRRIQRNPIRRIQVMECEYSGRYRTWSLLQEIPNTPYPTSPDTAYRPVSRLYKYMTLNSVLELGINDLALSDRHPTYHEATSDQDKLIQRRYSDTKMTLITTPSNTAISIDLFSNNVVQDFQENSDDEVDERSSHFAKDYFSKTSKPSYKSPVTGYSSVSKVFQPKFTPKLIQSSQSTSCQADPNDKEEVLDDEEVTRVKVLMALADDELTIGKNHARNDEWIDITMTKGASPSSEVESFTFQPHSPKERPGLGRVIYLSLNRSVSGTVTVSETERTIPSVPAEVKNTEQESKINE
ncbi:hypothetical protein Tco_0580997 [Tanacetum coccineum]